MDAQPLLASLLPSYLSSWPLKCYQRAIKTLLVADQAKLAFRVQRPIAKLSTACSGSKLRLGCLIF